MKIPVVVVEGSVRTADMLALTWKPSHNGDFRCCNEDLRRSCCVSLVQARGQQSNQCPLLRKEYEHCLKSKVDESALAKNRFVCRATEQVLVYNLNQQNIVNDFLSTQKQDREQNAPPQATAAGKAERRKVGHSLLKMM